MAGGLACPLCGATARLAPESLPGYQEPATFDLATCATCDVAFIPASDVDPGPLYERIYAQVECIPGYERYHRYSRGVLKAKDPLHYLAQAEDMYWAVAEYLAGAGAERAPRIIEVGSGIGYLTYALARRGFDVTGIDLAESAVTRARRAYGDLYECADVADLARAASRRYDLVIMTEVIEHVADPEGLLAALGPILSPGGEILVTTPDKSYYPPDAVWETEPPPVHLWWFSETALRFLARRVGYRVRTLDFGRYNRSHYCLPPPVGNRAAPPRPPVLDVEGNVREDRAVSGEGSRLRSLARDLGVTGVVRSLQARLATAMVGPHRRRPTLCAIFSKDPARAAEVRSVAQAS
ncbi:MAG TPA: methyltransferase domain-containing protein [Isosphaeraceae bacterium]